MAILRCIDWICRMALTIMLVILITITNLSDVVLYKIETDQKEICLLPHCVHIASTILENMDSSVDPCEDFYNFTCGNFLKITNIPDNEVEISVSSRLNNLIYDQLRVIFEEPTRNDELSAFRLAKDMYQACMNDTLLEEIGLTEIKDMLKKFGGWPVLEGNNWKEKNFDWKEVVYKFRKEGFSESYLIEFGIRQDANNSLRKIIHLDEPYLGLDREYLISGLEHKLVKTYYDYMVDIALIFGANKTQIKQELLESLKFEIELAKISHAKEERLNPLKLYNPSTVEELQNKYPSIPWLDYINNILSPEASVENNEIVLVASPAFLDNFEKLMHVTPERIQSNYLLWRAVQDSIGFLTKELRHRKFKYIGVSTGSVSEPPRWKQCLSTIRNGLATIVGALYVRNYFDKEAKAKIIEIVDDIKAELQNILENLDWMDERTRHSALQKLASMKVHVGYPPELLDDEEINKYFGECEVDKTKFWQSILNYNKFETKNTFSKFREPFNKSYWIDFSNSAVVNAFYSPLGNNIELPAGILQDVMFNKDYPKYINYGSIGGIIGHEISHGFDIQGRVYDKDGKLNDWWSNKTSETYNKKTQCFIDQYNNYTVPEIGMNINGLGTLAENIADTGGIKEAYYAYLKNIEKNGEEPYLPGLRYYNGRQMFWIATTLFWHSKPRVQYLKQRVITDEHSPPKYRVWGRVSNMKEFAKDFNCEPNSKMNPVKKCQVW